MESKNEAKLVDADKIKTAKTIAKSMALFPSSMQMGNGAITMLDILGLWKDGDVRTEYMANADIEMLEAAMKFFLSYAKRRGIRNMTIIATNEKNIATLDVGQYFSFLLNGEIRWNYEPRDGKGNWFHDDCQYYINPSAIRSFNEPPTENRPTTADQSTAER